MNLRTKTFLIDLMVGFPTLLVGVYWLGHHPGVSWLSLTSILVVLATATVCAFLTQVVQDWIGETRLTQLTERLKSIRETGDYKHSGKADQSDEAAVHLDAILEKVSERLAEVDQELCHRNEELAAVNERLTEEIEQRQQCEGTIQKVVAEFEERVHERTEELSRSNAALVEEVEQRTQAESALRQLHLELEERVRERTFELELANEMLVKEIDDRRQAEGERQKLVSLVENANDFIALATLDGEITFLNDAGRKLLALDSSSDAIGMKVEKIEAESSKGAFDHIILRAVIAQGSWTGEIALQAPSYPDKPIAAEVSAILVRHHETAKPVCVALVVRDITERHQAEAALSELEERFSRAFHASPAAVAIITLPEGKFVDVNRTFLATFGYESQEVNGRTMDEIQLWLAAENKNRLMEMVASSRPVRDQQCRWLTKSGATRIVQVAAEPLELSRQSCLLLVAEDITERLQLEDQLRQSSKMEAVGQLAAGIAHDFNNILTVVQGHTSLLLADQSLPEKSSESIKCVFSAADRAANLTRQLLTFSRKQVAQWRELELNKVVQNISGMLRSLISETISLSFHYRENLPLIRGDSNMLDQVILNLVVNARDAMPKGGNLVVDTTLETVDAKSVRRNPKARPGVFVCLTIMDTGCGMDAATLERIFEPFFTTKEFGQGTGLGLATVYGVVTQHNGWIDVTSQPGHGSLFRVYLPALATLPPKKGEPPTEKAPEARGGKETVLVVEDELGLRMLVEAVLQKYGYTVILAEHGKEALELWKKHDGQVDLLLTDMVMPEGLSGLELSERLRVEKPGLRIVYMSGYSVDFMGSEVTGIREGFNFLQKPYRPEQLVRAVREILDSAPQPLPQRGGSAAQAGEEAAAA